MNRDLKKLLNLRKKIGELAQEARTLAKKIAPTCDHSITKPFQWEHDNGYGHQTWCTGTRCDMCGAKKYYTESRWLFEDFEEEIINGKKLYEDRRAEKKIKKKAAAEKKKLEDQALAATAKEKLSKEELAALRRSL